MGPARRHVLPTPAIAVVVALLLTGCGGEREFSAEELAAELNAAGAGVELGEELPAAGEIEAQVWALTFSEHAGEDDHEDGEPGHHETDDHAHEAGAMVILPDSGAATGAFESCESALDFICYRVANAVLRFTGITAQERARVTEAVRALASE